MREPKTVYYGVPAYQWHPSEIATPDLLREMTTLARINYFLADTRGQEIIPQLMRDNYGALWGNGELTPLIKETRARAANGDTACQTFWSIFDKDPIVVRASPYAIGNSKDEKDTGTLTNQIYDLVRKYPEVRRLYGRVDPENLEIRMARPTDNRTAPLAALAATA